MRADLFASRGWVVVAPDSETITGHELLSIIRRTLDNPPPSAWEGFQMDGARKSVQALAECLEDRHTERAMTVPEVGYGFLPQTKLRKSYGVGRAPAVRSAYTEGALPPHLQ